MGTKQSESENIVIEAAGTGSTVNQVPVSRTEWMLIGLLVVLVISLGVNLTKKCKG